MERETRCYESRGLYRLRPQWHHLRPTARAWPGRGVGLHGAIGLANPVPEGPDGRAGEHGELPVYLLRLSIGAELGVPEPNDRRFSCFDVCRYGRFGPQDPDDVDADNWQHDLKATGEWNGRRLSWYRQRQRVEISRATALALIRVTMQRSKFAGWRSDSGCDDRTAVACGDVMCCRVARVAGVTIAIGR